MKNTWDRNLAALARLDAALAGRMRSLSPSSSVIVDETRSGLPSLRVLASDGVEVRLHSAYDPVKEARQFVEQRAPEEADVFVLSGVGLGYHVREVMRRMRPRDWLLLVEAKEELFRAALETVDLAGVFARPGTRVFVGTDWIAFLDWLRHALDRSEAQKITLVTYPPCVRFAPDFYERVAGEMESAVNRRQVELVTLVRRARDLDSNAIRNIAFLPGAGRACDLEGLFSGIPGIVVASGPSLSGNLEALKRAAGRAVIITVGKSLKLLAENGIEPEFTAALDMTPGSGQVFEGYGIPRRTILIYDQDSYHGVPRAYPGLRVAYESRTPIMKWAESVLGRFGTLEKGLSVAHTAFFLARLLGLDPIVLVGIDLAFPGDRTHAEGVTMTWGGEVKPDQPHYIGIPSVTGGKVRSIQAFLSFVTAFEVEIRKTKARVVNTTPDGALIRGAENLPLDEALSRYGEGKAPTAERLEEAMSKRRPFPEREFDEAADRLVRFMEETRATCAAERRSLRRLDRLDPSNRLDLEKIRKLGGRWQKRRNEIAASAESRYLGRVVAGTALELRRISNEMDGVTDRTERIRMEAKYLEVFFRGYEEAAGFFLERFAEMRGELRSRLEEGR